MAEGLKSMDGISAAQNQPKDEPAAEITDEKPKEDKLLLSWSAPSFVHKEKSFVWFLTSGLVVVSLIGFFIFTKDWFSVVITIVVAAVLFWYVAKVRPQKTDYSITEMGLYAGNHFYPFSEIHSYWMVYNEKIKTLNIAFLKKYLPTLIINIENVNPIQIKELLSGHLPEQEKRSESLIDKIIRTLGV